MDEIWKAIPDYEGLYDASNLGRVKSYYTGRILKSWNLRGYERVSLNKDGEKKYCLVHRLVYETFNGKIPEDMVIDHVDGNKNNNRLSNLRCVTQKENCNNPNTMTDEWKKNIAEITRKARVKPIVQLNKKTGEVIRKFECAADAARELGISFGNISSCCSGKTKSAGGWKWMFFMPPSLIYKYQGLGS